MNEKPADRISYLPSGFTVATVLARDLSEVVNADDNIPTLLGQSWPDKTAFHFEVSGPYMLRPLICGSDSFWFCPIVFRPGVWRSSSNEATTHSQDEGRIRHPCRRGDREGACEWLDFTFEKVAGH